MWVGRGKKINPSTIEGAALSAAPFLFICLEQTHYLTRLGIDIQLYKGRIGTGSWHQADGTSAGTQEL